LGDSAVANRGARKHTKMHSFGKYQASNAVRQPMVTAAEQQQQLPFAPYENVQVEAARADLRFVHSKIAPDNRVMFVKRPRNKALRPRFGFRVVVP
jgi:hypothetical protein